MINCESTWPGFIYTKTNRNIINNLAKILYGGNFFHILLPALSGYFPSTPLPSLAIKILLPPVEG